MKGFVDPEDLEVNLIDPSKAGRTRKIRGTLDIGSRRPSGIRERKSIIREKLRSGEVKFPKDKSSTGVIRVQGAGTPYFVEVRKKQGDEHGINLGW